MTPSDITGLILSYIYAFGLLFLTEGLGRRLHWPLYLTRKLTHIGAGMWIWGVLALFDHWFYGLIPFASFIVLNYLFWRRQTFRAMDAQDATLGTVYFAFSVTLLFALFWRTGGAHDRAPLAVAAIMAMTWGDGLAGIVGERWGRHPYFIGGHRRTWEGTAAMAAATFVAVLLTLSLLPGTALSPHSLPFTMGETLLGAVVAAIVAPAVEAISPAGTDNLSVPLLTALALFLVIGH